MISYFSSIYNYIFDKGYEIKGNTLYVKNENFNECKIPKYIKNIIFTEESNFNRPLKCNLPELDYLEFNDIFNQELKGREININTKNVKFGKCFNQEIHDTNAPFGLVNLEFGEYFDSKIDVYAFGHNQTLKRVKFGSNFSHELKREIFPDTVEILELGKSYDKIIYRKELPKDIKILKINSCYKKNYDIFLKYMNMHDIFENINNITYFTPCYHNIKDETIFNID